MPKLDSVHLKESAKNNLNLWLEQGAELTVGA